MILNPNDNSIIVKLSSNSIITDFYFYNLTILFVANDKGYIHCYKFINDEHTSCSNI